MNVAVIGASGYTGGMLLRMLVRHPEVGLENVSAVSASHSGKQFADAHADFFGQDAAFVGTYDRSADVVFLCTGHGKAKEWMQENMIDDETLVVDLSHDHRLNPEWVYGLPEKNRNALKTAKRIANPGCFATTIELGLLPLSEDKRTSSLIGSAVTNAITGSTGAGQSPSATTHFSWRANNTSVYKPFTHQHLAEIEMVLGAAPTFIPIRGAFPRGIFCSTVLKTELSAKEARELFRARYDGHPFVSVVDELPDVKRAVGTNACFIGIEEKDGTLLVVSVLDNLIKGASGQAIQNMNIASGLKENAGLDLVGLGY